MVLISQDTCEKFKNNQNLSFPLFLQWYILYLQRYKLYHWRNKGNSKFWLILNFSKVVWDINTKFLLVFVLMRIQLFTKFGCSNYIQNGFPDKAILNVNKTWGTHFSEPHPWDSGNLLLFSRCTNHISITFWIFWLYKSCKKCWSLPLQVFRASWISICFFAFSCKGERKQNIGQII